MRRRFGVLNRDFEEAALCKNAGVANLKLRIELSAGRVLLEEFIVRKPRLRIAVDHRHVTVRRRGIGVPVEFLYVFAVVALRSAHSEEAFL